MGRLHQAVAATVLLSLLALAGACAPPVADVGGDEAVLGAQATPSAAAAAPGKPEQPGKPENPGQPGRVPPTGPQAPPSPTHTPTATPTDTPATVTATATQAATATPTPTGTATATTTTTPTTTATAEPAAVVGIDLSMSPDPITRTHSGTQAVLTVVITNNHPTAPFVFRWPDDPNGRPLQLMFPYFGDSPLCFDVQGGTFNGQTLTQGLAGLACHYEGRYSGMFSLRPSEAREFVLAPGASVTATARAVVPDLRGVTSMPVMLADVYGEAAGQRYSFRVTEPVAFSP